MTRITTVKTFCCPDAKGNTPKAGDQKYTLKFPLEDGSYLFVEMGSRAYKAVESMMQQMRDDDEKEQMAGETDGK